MEKPAGKKKRVALGRTGRTARAIQFVILFAFWVMLTGRYELKYLLIGIAAAALVTYLTGDLIYKPSRRKTPVPGAGFVLRSAWHLLLYIPWLVRAIIKANIQVAIIIIKPKMPIDPVNLQFKTGLKNKVALVTLANSITLTPGTITVLLEKDTYTVHCLRSDYASDLETAVMQNKVGKVFETKPDTPPECTWKYSIKETKL
ncbi:MAG: Na+/H+ antiporter subunit E [Dehalococcoidales bacterium]|nr:Na+/H+ antiporter subunit E [Dehalococcoidales bacterium]